MEALQHEGTAEGRSLDLVYGDDGLCIAAWGPLLVGVWWRESTVRDMETFAAAQRALIEEHGMVSTLKVMRHALKLEVDEEVREVGTQTVRQYGPCTLGAALVVEETGLRANFFRSVVTGMYLTARTQTQYKVLSSIREGVDWVLQIPGTDLGLRADAPRVAAAVQELADRYC